MTFHTEGIILKYNSWRETGRMYIIYTRESGKVLAVGRGTRKILSKLAAHLEPYSRVNLFLARGKRHETIAGARMTQPSEPLVENDTRHVVASFVSESFNQLVKWGDADERLWSVLDNFYQDLRTAEQDNVAPLLAGYLWHFMDTLGYGPRLDECMVCEKTPGAESMWFMPTLGALCCPSCRTGQLTILIAETVTLSDLEEIRTHLTNPAEVVIASPAPIRIAHLFLEAHLDRPLMTQPLLREIVPLPQAQTLTKTPF